MIEILSECVGYQQFSKKCDIRGGGGGSCGVSGCWFVEGGGEEYMCIVLIQGCSWKKLWVKCLKTKQYSSYFLFKHYLEHMNENYKLITTYLYF